MHESAHHPDKPDHTAAHDPARPDLQNPSAPSSVQADTDPSVNGAPDRDEKAPATTGNEILQQLLRKDLSPKSLDPEHRLAVTGAMLVRGCSIEEISQVLEVNPRTVYRYQKKLRRAIGRTTTKQTADEIAGQLLIRANASEHAIRRAARRHDASVRDIITAEKTHFWMTLEIIRLLAKHGFLPATNQGAQKDEAYDMAMNVRQALAEMEAVDSQDAAAHEPAEPDR